MDLEYGERSWRSFADCRSLILAALLALTPIGDAQAQGEAKTIDLAKYCTDEHGPDAFVTRRLTDNARMCTLRTYGGLGLTHHVIDQASLCDPGTTPRVSGESTLDCVPGGGGPAAGTGADGGSGSPTPNAGPTGSDASGDTPTQTSEANGRLPAQDPDVDAASMQGTWEVDESREVPSNLLFPPGVKLTIDVEGDMITGRHVSGLEEKSFTVRAPIAQGEILFKGSVDDNGRISARGRLSLVSQIGHRACPDFVKEEKNWQPIEMTFSQEKIYGRSELGLFRLSPSGCCLSDTCAGDPVGGAYTYPWAQPGDRLNFVLKRTARVIEVTFTEAEAPYKRLNSLPLEDPFTITVKFDNPPGKESEAVTLKNKRSGKERHLMADKTEDPVIYRTKEITLKPTKAETCVAGC